MGWSVDTGIQVQNLISQIATRLTANGWTLTDRAGDQVWDSTNNQSVHQYIQITNCQSGGSAGSGANWMYLQFQAWKSWDTGGHAGATGSGTTLNRLYYAPANVAAATPVDLYMTVTANRFIMFIQGSSSYRNWAYFGGLDALAGTNDPFCALLLCAYASASGVLPVGAILSNSLGTNWSGVAVAIPFSVTTSDSQAATSALALSQQTIMSDSTQFFICPVLVIDAISPLPASTIRGNLDGLYYCPLSNGALGHLDTITISGTPYLVIQPGGGITANTHPLTGNYVNGLAIVEA